VDAGVREKLNTSLEANRSRFCSFAPPHAVKIVHIWRRHAAQPFTLGEWFDLEAAGV
jgi:hypothetical protein